MNKILLGTAISIFFFQCSFDTAKDTTDEKGKTAEQLVLATNWFQQSAEMRACFYQAYNLAQLRLKEHMKNYAGDKPTAVVLDIDETVLDNSPYEVFLIKNKEQYSTETWKNWTEKAIAKALPGALEFTKAAKAMGVEVIYISNRNEDELESTVNNLLNLGFPNADPHFVYLRKLGETGDKTSRRDMVMKKYEVLLFIGDNLTDLNQIFADRDSTLGFDLVDKYKDGFGNKFIVLPNPMYGEWEGAIYSNNYKISAEQKAKKRKDILQGF